jgi:hypothetical protein
VASEAFALFAVPFAGLVGFVVPFAGFVVLVSLGKVPSSGVEIENPASVSASAFAWAACCAGLGLYIGTACRLAVVEVGAEGAGTGVVVDEAVGAAAVVRVVFCTGSGLDVGACFDVAGAGLDVAADLEVGGAGVVSGTLVAGVAVDLAAGAGLDVAADLEVGGAGVVSGALVA